MAQHVPLKSETGLAIYFCDPRSPWQRGSNENTNGLLRQHFRAGGDGSGEQVSDEGGWSARTESYILTKIISIP